MKLAASARWGNPLAIAALMGGLVVHARLEAQKHANPPTKATAITPHDDLRMEIPAEGSAPGPTKPTKGEAVTTKSGLSIEILAEGSGPGAKPGQAFSVHYAGWLADGTKIDSSRDRGQPFSVTLGDHRLIEGWEEGLLGIRKGGRRKLTIPPKLGYGAQGTPGGPIPPSSTLVFDIERLGID